MLRFLPKSRRNERWELGPIRWVMEAFCTTLNFSHMQGGRELLDGFQLRPETTTVVSSSKSMYVNTRISQTIPEEVQGHSGELEAVMCLFIATAGP